MNQENKGIFIGCNSCPYGAKRSLGYLRSTSHVKCASCGKMITVRKEHLKG